MAVFDPFAILDAANVEEVIAVDEEMFTVEVGSKVLGIDEGLFFGIILGFLIAHFIGDL